MGWHGARQYSVADGGVKARGRRSVEEMEARYQDGSLEEADSWRDLQRLDRLEYRRDRLQHLLGSIA